MHANDTNPKLIHPELSYLLTGIFFEIHNTLGRYARERQYADPLESKLKELKIPYVRERDSRKTGNRVDFIVDEKIVVELKAKPFTTREDYYQL